MRRRAESTRKVRSDKKRDVQPFLSLKLKQQLFRFSFLCREPLKDTAERLCVEGSMSTLIFDDIQPFFRRNLSIHNHHYFGDLNHPRLNIIQLNPEKITIRFTQQDYEALANVAYVLDLPKNQTAAVLIKRTLNNQLFMDQYVQSHLNYLTPKEKINVELFLRTVWGYR